MEPNGSSWNTSRKSERTDHLLSRGYSKLRRTSSSSSLIGRLSSSLLCANGTHFNNEGLEDEHLSQLEDAAEIGGVSSLVIRRSHSLEHGRNKGASSFRRLFSFSSPFSQVNEDVKNAVSSKGVMKHDPYNSPKNCLISPLTEDIKTSLPICGSLHKEQEDKKEHPVVEHVSSLVHLAVFGILGVFSRYLLDQLFGPNMLGVTGDQEILYLDLPSNVVGSFLMGWLGVVFKADISRISDQLALGLSTGYLGSLTTFSSWNQNMVELTVKGHWASAVFCLVISLLLCAYCISLGVETAKGFKKWLEKSENDSRIWSKKQQLMFLLFLLLVWGILLETSGVLVHGNFENGGSVAQLWVSCLVAPLGVWIRWCLGSLNGRGIGKAGRYKWFPFGTSTSNVVAACVTAALATLKKAVNTKKCDTIASGVQFGLMGCLSTVSTFMAEFDAMRNSSRTRRARAYAAITFGISFVSATLIYSIPVWIRGYK